MDLKNNIQKFMKKIPFINFLVVAIGSLLIFSHIFKKKNNIEGFGHIEGFAQEEKFVLKNNKSIYDTFYVDVYDAIINDPKKNFYEINKIREFTKMSKKSHVLDIGCGIGHHINLLHSLDIPTIGLENSRAMISRCKSHYNFDIKYGNAMESFLFEPIQFTHIMCLFYTFYYMPSQEAFLRNCNKWLRFNGYMIIHLVDRNRFHPVVPQSEIFGIPTQKFAKEGERITKSVVKFKGFKYESDYEDDIENNKSKFIEILTDDETGNIRKNVHALNMHSLDDYVKMFKRTGFELKKVVNLTHVRYHYQYLYILQKVK